MENLHIEATKSTPTIDFDAQKAILNISGESYPENTTQFYAAVFEWLEKFFEEVDDQEVTINIELIYFNSSSSKVLMDLFDMLEELSEDGKKIVVNWIYDEDNDASLEYGEEFAEDIESLTFNLKEK